MKRAKLGRPVGVALDKQGALLVADDVGNTSLARDPVAIGRTVYSRGCTA